MKEPRIAIVTVNYDLEEDTIKCVDSLLKQDYKNREIVLVENGSDEGIYKRLMERYENVEFIRLSKNLGFVGGFNAGIKYAKDKGFDYVLIINNDTTADKNFAAEMIKTALTDKKIGIVGCKALYMGDRKRIQTAGILFNKKGLNYVDRGIDERDEGQYDKQGDMLVSGVAMLINLSMNELYFDKDFFAYFEDVDLCERVKRAGYRIVYQPKAVLEHRFSRTANKVSGFKVFYGWRNYLRVMRRYHSIFEYLFVLLKAWIRAIKYLFTFDSTVIKNYFKAILTA